MKKEQQTPEFITFKTLVTVTLTGFKPVTFTTRGRWIRQPSLHTRQRPDRRMFVFVFSIRP